MPDNVRKAWNDALEAAAHAVETYQPFPPEVMPPGWEDDAICEGGLENGYECSACDDLPDKIRGMKR